MLKQARRFCATAVPFISLFLLAGYAAAQSGTWSATGSMTNVRAEHAVVLLPSGKVLALGGRTLASPTNTAELYDPATGTWNATGSMTTPRMLSAVALLPSGKVLTAGGIFAFAAFAASNTAEIYDPATGTFSATGSMSQNREGASAVLLPNGKVLVAGGDPFICCSVASAELYDPASGTFSATGSMFAGHRGVAVLLQNGKVLMAGDSGSGGGIGIAELYDPATGTWTRTGNLNVPRGAHGMVVLPDGRVLAAGGSTPGGITATAELYDPATGAWTLTGSMNNPRSAFGTQLQGDLTLLANGTVLVNGGFSGTGVLAAAEIYDPATGTWSPTGSMTTVRTAHRTLLLGDGRTLASGGATFTGLLASAEIFAAVAVDNTAPVTTASTSPAPNAAGWNTGDVAVTLTATDTGSGVKFISYSINGGAPTTVNGASASFTVTATSTISYHATDNAGNVEAAKALAVRIDRIAPATSANAAPPANANGWNSGNVLVTLNATDTGGSGVQAITYTVTNGSSTTGNSIAGSSGSFTVSAEGVNTIAYGAIDVAGNAEASKTLTVRIDRQAPTTSANAQPAPNAAGWNNSNVTVTLSAVDNAGGSGVQSITYSINGVSTTVPGAGATFTLASEGVNTVTYRATDNAGNAEAAKSLTVRIDKTPPVLALPGAVTANATSPAGATVTYSATATDNSGVAPTVVCAPPSGSNFAIGATNVSCSAADVAGNPASGGFVVTVLGPAAQAQNLVALINGFDLNRGIANSLTTKLRNVACNRLEALIDEASAQSGKHLTRAQAAQIIAAANQIRAAQGCHAVEEEADERQDGEDHRRRD